MIKQLKLSKAIILIVIGIIALIVAQIMEANDMDESGIVLGISGGLLIIGALLLLYPILFAKKADIDGEKVELQPVAIAPDPVEETEELEIESKEVEN